MVAQGDDALERAWRDGWAQCKASLTEDEAFCLTEDVEHDAWLDSDTRKVGDDAPQAGERDLCAAGGFLLDRLVDHEVRMTSDEDANEWHGHVTPAMARFRSILALRNDGRTSA